MSNPVGNPIGFAKPKRTLSLLVAVLLAVVALVVGVALGAAATGSGAERQPGSAQKAGQAKPAPTVTVEASVPAPDGTCREVATELHSILGVTVNDALIPYNDVTLNLIEMLQYSDLSKIDETTTMIEDVTSVVENQTARLNAISGAYAKCTNP